MKRVISLLLCLMLILGSVSAASTIAFAEEDVLIYKISGGEVSITGLVNPSSSINVAIPETIEGCSVTSIASDAFRNCIGLTSITIPYSIKTIGPAAFSGCTGLKSVYYTGKASEWCNISFGNFSTSNPIEIVQ